MFDKVYLIKSISAVTNYNSSSCLNKDLFKNGVEFELFQECATLQFLFLKIRGNIRVYLERAHPAFLTTE